MTLSYIVHNIVRIYPISSTQKLLFRYCFLKFIILLSTVISFKSMRNTFIVLLKYNIFFYGKIKMHKYLLRKKQKIYLLNNIIVTIYFSDLNK